MGLTQTCQSQSSTHTFDTSIDTSVGYSDRKRFPSNTSNMGITYSADHPKYTGS